MWIKRGRFNTVRDIVSERTGLSEELLLNDTRQYRYPNIDRAASLFIEHVLKGSAIRVYGDYDSDGITSLAIFEILFNALRYQNVNLVAPRRFTDGYGINTMRIKQFHEEGCDLLVTIDNGIAAIKAIKLAKDLGIDVIILDHHQPMIDSDGDTLLPEADVIVDPHVTGGFIQESDEEFKDLCGAGIGLKFTEAVLDLMKSVPPSVKKRAVEMATCMAGIGTVADVVPLVGDNRKIVRRALDLISNGKGTPGLHRLLQTLDIVDISSDDIAFGLAPCLNASGRLYDDGAQSMVNMLSFDNESDELDTVCQFAKEANQKRKSLTTEAISRAQDYLMKNPVENAIIYADDNLSPGIAGLVASKLVEQYYKPAIVLSINAKGVCKGSGRSIEQVNLKEQLDKCQDLLIGYGGHPTAAGLSLEHKHLDEFRASFCEITPEYDAPKDVHYDIECDPNNKKLASIFEEINQYGPYGCGNESLQVMIPNIRLGDKMGNTHKIIGSNKNHIKFLSRYDFDLVWFDGADQYKALGNPKCVDVICSLGLNVFNGKTTIQAKISHLRKSEK